MQGASLGSARLQGASLLSAELQGASLERAELQGAFLVMAELQGASLERAQLQGASLDLAGLQGVSFFHANLQGASLEATSLQGAIFDRALSPSDFIASIFEPGRTNVTDNLSLVSISRAFLWGAAVNKCDGARVASPDVETVITPSASTSKSNLSGSTPETINEFIRRVADTVPEAQRDQLRATLHSRLSIQPAGDADTKNMKTRIDCAASAESVESEYAARLAILLRDLACTGGRDQKYVAEGIYWHRYRRSLFSSAQPLQQPFARGLLGLDGKPCPGAQDLSGWIKSELLAGTEGPANR